MIAALLVFLTVGLNPSVILVGRDQPPPPPHCESVVGFADRMVVKGYRFLHQRIDEHGRTYRDYKRVTTRGTSFARYVDDGLAWCKLDETNDPSEWSQQP